MSYPSEPRGPVNIFRVLPPPQHVITAARAAGVNTRSRAEIHAWRVAGRPATWTNGGTDNG